jgi:hypothetical protein
MKRVAIIGGGLSGLSAAYQLARDAQVEFTLFEASARLGGIVETIRQNGFVIECGPDSWVTEKFWARELAVELGLASEIIPSNDRQRRTYLLQHDQLVPMPDGMRMMVPAQLDAITDSPLFSEQARLAYRHEPERANELKASALKENEDESVASFVRRHFGDEVTRTIAGPLLAGVFGGDIETLSMRAVMPAFVKMEREHGSLIAALQSRAGQSKNAVFTTLLSGLSTLIERKPHKAGASAPETQKKSATPLSWQPQRMLRDGCCVRSTNNLSACWPWRPPQRSSSRWHLRRSRRVGSRFHADLGIWCRSSAMRIHNCWHAPLSIRNLRIALLRAAFCCADFSVVTSRQLCSKKATRR